jgi:hypothetical protein
MRLPPVTWAFFGLTVMVLAICALSQGVFIGSQALFQSRPAGNSYYMLACDYLYLTAKVGIWGSAEDAKQEGFCPVWGNSN